MLISEIIKKTTPELKQIEEESRAELMALRFQSSMGNVEKSDRIKVLRKDIARILTVLNSRKSKGENTNVKVKVDFNKTYEAVEKESQKFAKKRRAEVEKMMAEQNGGANNTDLPNFDEITVNKDLTVDEVVDVKTTTTTKKPAAAKTTAAKKTATTKTTAAKPAAAKKTATTKTTAAKPAAAKKTATNKTTAAKPAAAKKEVEAKPAAAKTTAAKKATTTKTTAAKPAAAKKEVEAKPAAAKTTAAKKATTTKTTAAKPAAAKKEVVKKPVAAKTATTGKTIGGVVAKPKTPKAIKEETAIDRLNSLKKTIKPVGKTPSNIEDINIEGKEKPKDATTYTYGTNWEENRDKIEKATIKKTSKINKEGK
ncbi:50S ribosomal protein L29 [Spiroplasma endosymbiont of Anurida maritima]|uniref:50S ribosomal protein L29 n=1 Tax=Spiroplasma endosymbiont of Anurida maritima TaxID=2967972 RepID=UPI0036D4055D